MAKANASKQQSLISRKMESRFGQKNWWLYKTSNTSW